MYEDKYSGSISTSSRVPSAPPEWAFNRFLRGYVGALPASAFIAALLFTFGWIDTVEAYGIAPLIAGLVIIPAVIAVRAMQVMPTGSEASFLHTRIVPKLGEGLRGIVLLAILVAVWSLGVFVLLGALGMIWSALRRLLT